jgi:thermosome subunit
VLEPVRVKRQVLKSATEAATSVLKIDDLIAASQLKSEGKGEGKGKTGQGEEGEGGAGSTPSFG